MREYLGADRIEGPLVVAEGYGKAAYGEFVEVHAPGGTQTVRWQQQVFLRGPAQLICRGEFLV